MAKTTLDQLKAVTTVVADTGDFKRSFFARIHWVLGYIAWRESVRREVAWWTVAWFGSASLVVG